MRRARGARAAILAAGDPIDPAASLERFRALGLDGNPFRELGSRAGRAWVEGRSPSPEQVIASEAPCVQVIGAPGSGKTSLLAELSRRFESAGRAVTRRFLAPDHDGSFPEFAEAASIVCLDEAQRLDRRGRASARAWLEAGARRLVCATHEDLSRALGETETFRLEATNAQEVARVFTSRVLAAGADPARFELTRGAARRLVEDAEGSLRGVVERLHRLFESLTADLARVVIDERLVKRVCER